MSQGQSQPPTWGPTWASVQDPAPASRARPPGMLSFLPVPWPSLTPPPVDPHSRPAARPEVPNPTAFPSPGLRAQDIGARPGHPLPPLALSLLPRDPLSPRRSAVSPHPSPSAGPLHPSFTSGATVCQNPGEPLRSWHPVGWGEWSPERVRSGLRSQGDSWQRALLSQVRPPLS